MSVKSFRRGYLDILKGGNNMKYNLNDLRPIGVSKKGEKV